MYDEPNYLSDKHDSGDCLEYIATQGEQIRKQGMEIARLRRENEELKRDNKKLGEVKYILRMLNIARNSLARIERMGSIGAKGNVLKDAIDIARQASRNILAEEREMRKWHSSGTSNLPEIDTY